MRVTLDRGMVQVHGDSGRARRKFGEIIAISISLRRRLVTTERKVKPSKTMQQTVAYSGAIGMAHGIAWLCSPADYRPETLN